MGPPAGRPVARASVSDPLDSLTTSSGGEVAVEHGASYEMLTGDAASPVVLHVPHSSRAIPGWVREHILLDDAALLLELDAMTDAFTDEIAAAAVDVASRWGTDRPWAFVNRLSRLVIDPERFPDPDDEEMARVGMGAVYTATHDGGVLREADDTHGEALMSAYFRPYADALGELVEERLDAHARALVIDVHSYPRDRLPYERHPSAARPAVCLGADDVHTPPGLRAAAESAFAAWEPVWNQPFAGTYVPTRHFRVDSRVASVMVEIRRDVYLAPDGSPDPRAVAELGSALAELATWTP
jgi:N-formylglutamate amidohydrolase